MSRILPLKLFQSFCQFIKTSFSERMAKNYLTMLIVICQAK